VVAYLEAIEFVTEEIKVDAEKRGGEKLSDEVVGVRVAEYTGRNKEGLTRYDALLAKAREYREFLTSEKAHSLTTYELKEYARVLNTEFFPTAVSCVTDGIMNMKNAFSRQNISEEIIDFFEEHNFSFNGFAYEADMHDKALYISFVNETTGEELTVTLAPELVAPGDFQTRVELDQLAGDAADEARKAYYRQAITDVVMGGHPGAQVELKCIQETVNQNSTNTRARDRIRQAQQTQLQN
jgi:hypothetical protein